MTEALSNIKTGQVTFAARNSEFDGLQIEEGDILGMEENKITILGTDANDVAMKVIENLTDDGDAVITLFYGSDVSGENAQKLSEHLREKYPKCDVITHCGGQPLYYYIISVE